MDLKITSTPIKPISPAPSRPGALEPAGKGFGDTLGRVLADLQQLQAQAKHETTQLAAGKSQDTMGALVAIQKADISFQFALQIRNKLLEAYQEVMRMQV